MKLPATYHYQIFISENEQKVLIAAYRSHNPPPVVGSLINIVMFKKEARFPDAVRVLEIEQSDEIVIMVEPI